jgi:3-hydroxy-9,10-secoandrosta-1,3,5(10)-triene-9,17-dione monooxygenase
MPDLPFPDAAASREADPAAFLHRIDALLPELRARAGETERAGQVPADIVSGLTDAGVFRATQPRQWGGLELDLATFYEGMARLASACASTGWVASVVGIHPWHIALFANQAQRDVWSENKDERASTSLAPTGKVEHVDGGFLLSGKWYFSSGVDHCGWAVLGGIVPNDDGGEYRTFLVPRADYTIDHDSWHVTGLGGTGSKAVVLKGAFVPDYRTHSVVDVYHGTDPGFEVNDRPYYRLPWRLVFGYCIAAPCVGAAVGALEAFIATNSDRLARRTAGRAQSGTASSAGPGTGDHRDGPPPHERNLDRTASVGARRPAHLLRTPRRGLLRSDAGVRPLFGRGLRPDGREWWAHHERRRGNATIVP